MGPLKNPAELKMNPVASLYRFSAKMEPTVVLESVSAGGRRAHLLFEALLAVRFLTVKSL